MLLLSLLIVPIVGISIVSTLSDRSNNFKFGKSIGLVTSVVNLIISLLIFILFHFSNNQFQFVQEYHEISSFDFYLGIDGISIYFVLLTTLIMPIALLSNWSSITEDAKSYVIIILLLETLLLGVFVVLDILMFYIFFESILPPLFVLIGIFGSSNRVRASFYLFLYTLLGSLFLLLSILTMSSIMGTTDFDALFKTNFNLYTQILLFSGIFIAFAVKTPTIFLNSWLLKAHVESPLGGSIILAGIVLKLSLYGILRLILPLLPKAYMYFTPIVYVIGAVTILYASISTLRTIDVKELIAYSSVSHAAVYLVGVFSNSIQGIEGGIVLGLAHGFVSSGLFICAGGVLYDRSSTRLITFYRGIAQLMPIFSILFFILCLGNAGTPLSLNFIGEFMSLYGTFERLPLLGIFACSSIVFSAAYTIYMFNRIAFGGSMSKLFRFNIFDLSKREFNILLAITVFTVFFGIYPSPILDGLHFNVSSVIYSGMLFFPLTFKASVKHVGSRRFISDDRNFTVPDDAKPRMIDSLEHDGKQQFHDKYLQPMLDEVKRRQLICKESMENIIEKSGVNDGYLPYFRESLNRAYSSFTIITEGVNGKLNLTRNSRALDQIELISDSYHNVSSKFEDLTDKLAMDSRECLKSKKPVDAERFAAIASDAEDNCVTVSRNIIDIYKDCVICAIFAKRHIGRREMTKANDLMNDIKVKSREFNLLSSRPTPIYDTEYIDNVSIQSQTAPIPPSFTDKPDSSTYHDFTKNGFYIDFEAFGIFDLSATFKCISILVQCTMRLSPDARLGLLYTYTPKCIIRRNSKKIRK